MPELLAPSIIAKAGPLILETFLKHYLDPRRYKEEKKAPDARVDFMYDEAFSVVKTFLATSSNHTANALQKFGMTRTPAPPWVAVHRLHVPHPTLADAAEYLVTALGGEEMAYKVAGGIKWWQVRAGPGVESEWICMKKEYKQYVHEEKQWSKEEALHGQHDIEDAGFLPEMDRMRCMLYIHGGAYYWGSINTHRYAIWRFARKMGGRAFAVNYRKAPQYPFPCAIQDCLAAWLYLVNPPPGAPHRPVNPKNIIIAGDSAGGGLVWALLQILRDTPGLDLPAGAVLISPWSDLTHSFPSILQNTKTDVIPPYGFLHKPSSLWPPPRPDLTEHMQSTIASKVKGAVKSHYHRHGERQPDSPALGAAAPQPLKRSPSQQSIHTSDLEAAGKLKELLKRKKEQGEQLEDPAFANPGESFAHLSDSRANPESRAASTLSQCTDPLRLTVLGKRLAIDNQIQLYATNAQLCHPYVSPILGYLGGLPPLYILAGDKEVLRDEILYCAHKAAHPDEHPLREDVKQLLPSLQGIERKHGPTNVHLQVYDGVGHDLPLFAMTTPSRGSFRAIASFCRYVTPVAPNPSSHGSMAQNPRATATPHLSSTLGTDSGIATPTRVGVNTPPGQPQFTSSPLVASPALSRTTTDSKLPLPAMELQHEQQEGASADPNGLSQRLENLQVNDEKTSLPAPATSTSKRNSFASLLGRLPKSNTTSQLSSKRHSKSAPSGDDSGASFDKAPESKALPGTAGHMSVYAGENPFHDGHMIRERVDIRGTLRPLEAEDQLGAMTMPAKYVGVIKEGPALRFVEGQSKWDHKFKRSAARVERHRKKNLKKSKEHDSKQILERWERVAVGRESRLQSEFSLRTPAGERIAASDSATGSATRTAAGKATRPRASRMISNESTNTATTNSAPETDSDTDSDSAAPSPDANFDFGPTWAWQWALDDEAPPPTAIVSRRDLPEGRNLALMADGLESCSNGPDSVANSSSLSLWVLFATFFSSSGESDKTTHTLREAKQLREEEKRQKRVAKQRAQTMVFEIDSAQPGEVTTSGDGDNEPSTSSKKPSKFGRLFGKGA